MSPGHGCTQKHKVTQCVFYLCKFLTSWQQNIAHCTHKNHQINSQQILEVGSTIKKMRRLGRWLSWKSTLLHKCEGLSLFPTMHIINAMCGDRFIIKLQGQQRLAYLCAHWPDSLAFIRVYLLAYTCMHTQIYVQHTLTVCTLTSSFLTPK